MSAGEALQKMKYLVETGRMSEAKKILVSVFIPYHEKAREARIHIEFFERRTYVRMPYEELPGHKPTAFIEGSMGGWEVPEEEAEYRFHIVIELIIDGTSGHVEVLPGAIEITSFPVLDKKAFTTPERDAPPEALETDNARQFDKDFLKRFNISNDFLGGE